MNELNFTLSDFEGPLDLLLHLISKNKYNINDIPISNLVDQYIEQINLYKEFDMDIASEFLEMASRLIYLKTVSLLPKHEEAETLKAELTGELIEYQLCRQMAQKLSTMTEGFKTAVRSPVKVDIDKAYKRIHEPDVLVRSYLDAVGRGLRRLPPPAEAFTPIISKKIVSVSSRIIRVLRNLWNGKSVPFKALFKGAKSRSEVVATFLAVLELVKVKRIVTDGSGEEMTVKIDKEKRNIGKQEVNT
ncbi:MAG: segregation/condensation protein A [Acutalibacteraceae bacterium]|nr:segregation/condensation protein A [Acutalibacteraceae bacterium]